MNQALAFGVLFAGGILLTKAVTGSTFSQIVSGHPGAISTTGQNLLSSGVAGVGQSMSNAGAGGTWPPSGVTVERTDQGVDFGAPAGLPIPALASGTVTGIIPNWYRGQPAVFVSSPGLPGGATGIYYAEGLQPNVKIGQQISKGQTVGTTTGGPTGLEFGFAKGLSTLAQATTGYLEGQATHAGDLFKQWLGL